MLKVTNYCEQADECRRVAKVGTAWRRRTVSTALALLGVGRDLRLRCLRHQRRTRRAEVQESRLLVVHLEKPGSTESTGICIFPTIKL